MTAADGTRRNFPFQNKTPGKIRDSNDTGWETEEIIIRWNYSSHDIFYRRSFKHFCV